MLLVDEAEDSRLSRLLRRGLPALVIAVTVNLAILLALAAMNRAQVPETQETMALHVAAIHPRVQELPPPEPPEPQTEPPLQVMTVQLDAPADSPPPPVPLALDLPLTVPTMAAVHVAVSPRVPEPAPAPAPVAAPAQPSPAPARQVSREPRQVARLPRELSIQPPSYPRSYQRRGVEGEVEMILLINEAGRVEHVEFISGAPAFQRAVEDVVYQWRFEPSTVDGQPVKVRGNKTIRFDLEGRR